MLSLFLKLNEIIVHLQKEISIGKNFPLLLISFVVQKLWALKVSSHVIYNVKFRSGTTSLSQRLRVAWLHIQGFWKKSIAVN